MTISEKVAYLKGLAEGLGLDPESSKESKTHFRYENILEDIGLSISELDEEITELGEEIDVLSDDLSDVEEVVFEEDEDEEDFFEIKCPNCKEIIALDSEALDNGEIVCPNCKETLSLQFEDCCCAECSEDEDEDEDD